jgi:hypothetical protein
MPCATTSPADWIVNSGLPWYELATLGPACFDDYARLRFMPDPDENDDDDGGVPLNTRDRVS